MGKFSVMTQVWFPSRPDIHFPFCCLILILDTIGSWRIESKYQVAKVILLSRIKLYFIIPEYPEPVVKRMLCPWRCLMLRRHTSPPPPKLAAPSSSPSEGEEMPEKNWNKIGDLNNKLVWYSNGQTCLIIEWSIIQVIAWKTNKNLVRISGQRLCEWWIEYQTKFNYSSYDLMIPHKS